MNYTTINDLMEQLDGAAKLYAGALTDSVDTIMEFISIAGIPPSGSVRLDGYLQLAGQILQHRDELIQDTLAGYMWTAGDILDACGAMVRVLEAIQASVEGEEQFEGDTLTYSHREIDELIAASAAGLNVRYFYPVRETLVELFKEQVEEDW